MRNLGLTTILDGMATLGLILSACSLWYADTRSHTLAPVVVGILVIGAEGAMLGNRLTKSRRSERRTVQSSGGLWKRFALVYYHQYGAIQKSLDMAALNGVNNLPPHLHPPNNTPLSRRPFADNTPLLRRPSMELSKFTPLSWQPYFVCYGEDPGSFSYPMDTPLMFPAEAGGPESTFWVKFTWDKSTRAVNAWVNRWDNSDVSHR